MITGAEIRRSLRRGFTMIELLVVITIIILLSGIFLSLTPGDGGGLSAGQQMLASSIRSLRAMALMNRGVSTTGVSYNLRYRLLILNDPTDQANHLRQFVLAIGGGASSSTAYSSLLWFSPSAPSVLPNGVYFMPPDNTTVVNLPADFVSGNKRSLSSGLSIIGQVADGAYTGNVIAKYAPLNTPLDLLSMSTAVGGSANLKPWYCVELQPGGASNHIGRVVLVLANGSARWNAATSKVEIDLAGDGKLAAIALRPNGDVTLTNDSDDLTTAALKQQ